MSRLVSIFAYQIARTIVVGGLLLTVAGVASAQDRIYWDGGNTTQNGAVDGGDGTWDDASTNWTSQTGGVNYTADGLGALPDRRFSGAGGTVNVTATTPQAGRMQFSSSGYRLQGAAVDVQGRLVLSTGTTTTIANALTADGLESASTGVLIIDATGTLQIDSGESVAAIAGNITNNGTLAFNRSDDLVLTNTINGTGLIRQQGAGILTFNRAGATYSGNVEVVNATFRPNNVEILGVVTLDGGTLRNLQPADPPAEIALRAGGGAIFVDVPTFGTGNNISGIGKLTKTGAGQLRLNGNRTFSGGMDINEGAVIFRDSSGAVTTPFGTGPVTVAAGARLDLSDAMTVPNAVSLVATSDVRIATSYPITLSGNINFGGGSEAITLLGGTTADQTVNFSGVLSNGGFLVDATAISSARTLEFSGAGANTYTGLTRLQTVAGAGLRFRLNKSANVTAVPANLTVDTGTQVIVAAHEQIADTATVQLDSGSTMTLGDAVAVTETISMLNGAGALNLSSLSELRLGSGSLSGVISGDGALVKQGTGSLLLSGTSTYTGNTSVTAGQLQVSGSLVSAVTVSSGATLSGAGTVGTLQVNGGGTVAPGASAGTLNTGSLSLAATAIINMELAAPGTTGGGVNDLIQVTGNLVLDGVLNVSDLGGLAAGTYTLMTYTGALTDNGLTVGTTPAGFVYSLDVTQSNAVNLIVASRQAALTLSGSELDFGTRSITAAASSQVLTVTSSGNISTVFASPTITGTHAADFSISADTCASTILVVAANCTITITQSGTTAGMRSAVLNIRSDAHDNPHAVTLSVRRVGLPTLAGLNGISRDFTTGAGALRLDQGNVTVLGVPEALNLDGGTLRTSMVTGANAAEDVFSFASVGGVSLSGTAAGSNVLVDATVIGTLENAVAAGNVLGVTFNTNATVARAQTLMRAITYQNINTGSPVTGVREAEISLTYLGQSVTATLSIDVKEAPVVVLPPVEPSTPPVVTGSVETDVAGSVDDPVTIRDATVDGGVTLTHVIIGSGVTLAPGVILGEGVIFEAPGLIQALQLIPPFGADGASLEQLANGQIRITASGYRALLLPFATMQASAGQLPGIHYGDNGEVILIASGGMGIRLYALHNDGEALSSLLSGSGLQQNVTSTGQMQVTSVVAGSTPLASGATVVALSGEEVYFSARADLVAVPAGTAAVAGIVEYPVAGLGTVQQLSSLFLPEEGELMQQDLMPASADWPALRDALLAMPGITAVSLDTRGVIDVSVDGIQLRGVMDYTVVRSAAGSGALVLDAAGDLTGNGMGDYRVTYSNGDQQYLFIYADN
ncbi:hypothetical protein PHACT_11105 [Pseudohongiella acticola]|uniref:ESPR domain-containing protein n=1 Tax=Pseudohongiella acticola TaxID=1524254 RepID=A0A1E8CMG6_9GAMM|nr:choice-of-anchor D domain-containing protein [Pseudohongiella acticola]OFE13614.1 hypothetical protein PHACT_11105 [Pseudohongiella acticola]